MQQYNTDMHGAQLPPKPDNNLVLAIVTTICCCLPFGIVAIIKAANVNSLYMAGQYDLAVASAAEAKKWALIGIAIGVVINLASMAFYLLVGLSGIASM